MHESWNIKLQSPDAFLRVRWLPIVMIFYIILIIHKSFFCYMMIWSNFHKYSKLKQAHIMAENLHENISQCQSYCTYKKHHITYPWIKIIHQNKHCFTWVNVQTINIITNIKHSQYKKAIKNQNTQCFHPVSILYISCCSYSMYWSYSTIVTTIVIHLTNIIKQASYTCRFLCLNDNHTWWDK